MIAAAGSPAQLSDHDKKRKLEDLETDAPEPLSGVDSRSKDDGDNSDGNAEEEEGDESELKRQRLEGNADNNDQPDGLGIFSTDFYFNYYIYY